MFLGYETPEISLDYCPIVRPRKYPHIFLGNYEKYRAFFPILIKISNDYRYDWCEEPAVFVAISAMLLERARPRLNATRMFAI